MKWITRERPKIDRVACPWLITRFIDEQPEFYSFPRTRCWPRAKPLARLPTTFPALS